MNSVILIPARMESSRFPGKPLKPILNKPMIQWVYEAASRSTASDVFIITDSQEILEAARAFGADTVETSSNPINGTERCMEAMSILDPSGEEYDVIINVQGDEPLIKTEDIDMLLQLFDEDEVDIATMIKAIDKEEDYRNPNVVKAIPTLFNDEYCDLCYFSRSPIPHMDNFKAGSAFKHIGVYGFTATAFQEIQNMDESPYENLEKLEQLRWLQNHMLISAFLTQSELIGVDTEADLVAVENFLTSNS